MLAESLGAKVIFYDNVPVLPMGNAKAVRSMDELLAASDFVSLHVPLTMATTWMVGARVCMRECICRLCLGVRELTNIDPKRPVRACVCGYASAMWQSVRLC